MIDYSIDNFKDDFPQFKPIVKRDYVLVKAVYDWNLDYAYDSRCHEKVLKNDAIPRAYSANGMKFKTIEELIIHIELTYGNDVDIMVDADKYTDDILKMWYEHQTANALNAQS